MKAIQTMLKSLLLTGWVLLIVAGCRAPGVVSSTSEVKKNDSTYERTTARAVKLTVKEDSSSVKGKAELDFNSIKWDGFRTTSLPDSTKKTNPCPKQPDQVVPVFKPKTWKAKSKTSSVDLSIDAAGNIEAKSNCDSVTAVAIALDKELYHYKSSVSSEKKEVPVYVTRWIDKVCRWISGLTLLAGILFFFIKTNRIKL